MSEVKRYGHQQYNGKIWFEEREDGKFCSYDDYVALKAERDALAAENVALLTRLRNIIDIVSKADNRYCMCGESMDSHSLGGCGSPIGMLDYHFGKLTDENPETPATDAYLNSVRAEGLEMLAAEHQAIVDTLNGDSLFADGERRHASIAAAAVHFAAKLRAGEPS